MSSRVDWPSLFCTRVPCFDTLVFSQILVSAPEIDLPWSAAVRLPASHFDLTAGEDILSGFLVDGSKDTLRSRLNGGNQFSSRRWNRAILRMESSNWGSLKLSLFFSLFRIRPQKPGCGNRAFRLSKLLRGPCF